MQLQLNVSDSKAQLFIEFLKSLNYVSSIKKIQVDDGDSKEATLNNLREGFKELKLLKQGKIKGTSAKDFLNEL